MATRTKRQTARVVLTYEDLHKLIGLKDDAEILCVDSTYNRVSIAVQHPSIRAGSGLAPRALQRCKDLFVPKEPVSKPTLSQMRAALRIALTNHGEILLQDGTEAFINKFGVILVSHGILNDPDLDDEDDDDDDTD